MTQRPRGCSCTLCPLQAGPTPPREGLTLGGPVRPLPLGGFVLFPAENPPFTDNIFAQRDEPAAGWGTALPPRPPRRDRGVRDPTTASPRLPSLPKPPQKPQTRLFYLLHFIAWLRQPEGKPRHGEGDPGVKALAAPESEPGAFAATPPNPTWGRAPPSGGLQFILPSPPTSPEPARETKDDKIPCDINFLFFSRSLFLKIIPDFGLPDFNNSPLSPPPLLLQHRLAAGPVYKPREVPQYEHEFLKTSSANTNPY